MSNSKEDLMQYNGLVTEILKNAEFRVQLDSDHKKEHIILAYASGKMRKNRIRVLEGDRVIVEMTTYDLNRGRIIFREK